MIHGYHSKRSLGRVPRKLYEYFEEHQISLEAYADWDEGDEEGFAEEFGQIPDSMQPFPLGCPFHPESSYIDGPALDDFSKICVVDTLSEEIIWSAVCGEQALKETGVGIALIRKISRADYPTGSALFVCRQIGKGVPFSGTFESKTHFTPSKLSLECVDFDEEIVISDIYYDREVIENTDCEVTIKSSEAEWAVLGSWHNGLEGLTFVLTGTLAGMTREEAKARIESAGGHVSGSISRNTSYLVAGKKAGSQLEKAREWNIPILSESDLLTKLSNNQPDGQSSVGTIDTAREKT